MRKTQKAQSKKHAHFYGYRFLLPAFNDITITSLVLVLFIFKQRHFTFHSFQQPRDILLVG